MDLLNLIVHPFNDADPFGLMQAPGISWFGTVAILVFIVVTAAVFWVQSRRAVCPLVDVTGQIERIAHSSWKLDREGLFFLDSILEGEDRLRPYWRSFRESLLFERAEQGGKIFSSRGAEEFFSWDMLIGQRLNLAYYASVPGFVVGLGLLLTFVAILIGLYQLQIQGLTRGATEALVRGLAGKFLTSIMALACSSVFLLEEKLVSHRLAQQYEDFIGTLNALFTRRTLEQILNEFLSKLADQSTKSSSQEWQESLHAFSEAVAQLSRGSHGILTISTAAVQDTLQQLEQKVQEQQSERVGGETAPFAP